MTETFSLPTPTVDPGVSDQWRSDLHNLIQDEISRGAVTYFRGEVAQVDGAFVDVRRLYKIGPEQPTPPRDEMLYPVVSGPYGLAVGDLVDCLQLPIGGVIALRRMRPADVMIPKIQDGTALHDNSATGRVVASGSTDADRAIDAPHLKTNAADSRVVGVLGTANYGDDTVTDGKITGMAGAKLHNTTVTPAKLDRSYITDGDNVIGGGRLLGHSTDNALRAVDTPHLKTNSATGRVVASGSTDADRAIDAPHLKTNAADSRVVGVLGTANYGDDTVTPAKLDRSYSPPHSHPYAPSDHGHSNYARLAGDTFTGNTYVQAEFSADRYYMYFGGWRLVKRDAQGYLWC